MMIVEGSARLEVDGLFPVDTAQLRLEDTRTMSTFIKATGRPDPEQAAMTMSVSFTGTRTRKRL